MNRKENMEKIMEYLLDQILFEKQMLRDSKHKMEDAIEDKEDEVHINFYKRCVEKRENNLTNLREMLQFMQELHYEEESK